MQHERTKEELEAWAELLATCVWRLLDGGPEVRPLCRRAFEGYVPGHQPGRSDQLSYPRVDAPKAHKHRQWDGFASFFPLRLVGLRGLTVNVSVASSNTSLDPLGAAVKFRVPGDSLNFPAFRAKRRFVTVLDGRSPKLTGRTEHF